MANNSTTSREYAGYDRLKQYNGSRYSGMKVGASHKWYYDQGVWKERKVTPDQWNIFYQTTKRRAGHAPEESGAPVGTKYNWLIVSHQMVDKLDANSYMTCLEGKKFKVAHLRASKGKWNIGEQAQREKVIQYLQQVIRELEQADERSDVYTTGETERIYGLDHRTRQDLAKMAADMDIPRRSRLGRQALLDAIKRRMEEKAEVRRPAAGKTLNGKAGNVTHLENKNKHDLLRIANARHIVGRFEMKKAELLTALKKDMTKEIHRGART